MFLKPIKQEEAGNEAEVGSAAVEHDASASAVDHYFSSDGPGGEPEPEAELGTSPDSENTPDSTPEPKETSPKSADESPAGEVGGNKPVVGDETSADTTPAAEVSEEGQKILSLAQDRHFKTGR